MTDPERGATPVGDEKVMSQHKEHMMGEVAHEAAERGHLATDEYGQPLVKFDKAAESKLRLKIDLYIVPTVAVMYLFCFIDRANIGNAKLAGFNKDLGLVNYDYNAVLSVFFISYIIFEIPSNIMCKWVGPGWWLPGITLGFGICSVATAFVHDIHSASGVRFLLGMFEAGLLPGIAYYLSRWYRRSELAFRLSLYIVMAPLAGAFGGLLASGILKLDHFGGLRTWRMIFAIEGIVTIGIGMIAFFTLTDRPETARWLTQEEKDLAVARVKSERVGTTEVLDKLDMTKTLRGIFSPVTITTSFVFLLNNITVQGLGFFAPTIVQTIYPDASVISQQLHTVPPYVVGGFFTLLFPYLSWRFDNRMVFFVVSPPLMITGKFLSPQSVNFGIFHQACFISCANDRMTQGISCSSLARIVWYDMGPPS
ncbi:unnamed protein product [Penicillium salamii]|uniref:Major facilitator superfamily (MFS) profile domain-containing protein n=1 Tax=Penicillium salamii TaxID=1612424 RepID=A0A9W4NU08_9EURO|nr:unnamed protein product [Penicillium salamii]CAG8214915.1 unnamed protein product [Penicillium salamii]CAG8247120.1 unnamed protein product [Penicillium salamii]CAG8271535.1 unnamed protein product [Penicillium salamii]CAG8271830.1 unnamed protein product [Penicillium salamii]